jgi:hypothetical protein
MHFMARHTSIDCHEKRGKRGYLFIIGDEMPYLAVSPQQVSQRLGHLMPAGPERRNDSSLSTDTLIRELTRKFDVYYILPEGSSYAGNADVLDTWRALLGQNVIQLDDLGAVCETIALTIGLAEDRIDLAAGLEDLRDVGSAAGGSVERALGRMGHVRADRTDPALRYIRGVVKPAFSPDTEAPYDNRPTQRW